ncbi:MAG: septum site-determining protein MinD [Candidatus Borkfalkiaceae bacterium]|nr:septum site-determining protein MinD [Christensenellaceae bacterium]
MAKNIVITSGKGGVGKTTVTANLGLALANYGERVLLMDIDFGLNNLDVVMGLENKVVYDINDVLEGRCRVKQALLQDKRRKNLYIMPSNSIDGSSAVSGQNVKVVIENLSSMFDYVLLDCPAGIDLGFHRAVSCADEAIVVATPNIPSLRDADKVISILAGYNLDKVGLVLNRARGDLMVGEKMMMPSDIQTVLKTKLVGVLPEEDAVFLSCGYELPRNSDSFKAYKMLAQNVYKGTDKIFNVTDKYSGFFGSIRRSIKRNV